jgi:hypothetical protein
MQHVTYIDGNRAIINAIETQISKSSSYLKAIDETYYEYANSTNSGNVNEMMIEKKRTITGSSAVYEDELLHIVITQNRLQNIKDSYLNNVTNNINSTYTPINRKEPGIYKVYRYSPSYAVLLLEERLK